jgi:hypothetical protein
LPHELVAEAERLNQDLWRAMVQAPLAGEVPTKIHSRDTDAGGGPAFHPAFLRYIDHGVCTCGRAAICSPNCRFLKDKVLGHLPECEPACRTDTRFHPSKLVKSPTRMSRALRLVRKLNPHAYDFIFLIVARHYTFEQAAAKLNDDNRTRGLPELSDAQYAVLYVSAGAMLAAAF